MTETTTTHVLREHWAQARCMDAAEFGSRLEPHSAQPAAVAEAARRAERVLAAWDGSRYCYPEFQLGAGHHPQTRLSELLEVLPRERDRSLGADAVLWMLAPDAAFDDLSPSDVFMEDPDRVISLARSRLYGCDDAE